LRSGKIPDPILNAPELDPGLFLYWTAFWELQTCRTMGFSGAGPIPWTVLQEYADRHEFDPDQRELLVYFIGMMDHTYQKWVSKEQDKDNGGPQIVPKSGRSARPPR
jgi:hypothetical protein